MSNESPIGMPVDEFNKHQRMKDSMDALTNLIIRMNEAAEAARKAGNSFTFIVTSKGFINIVNE